VLWKVAAKEKLARRKKRKQQVKREKKKDCATGDLLLGNLTKIRAHKQGERDIIEKSNA